MIRNGEPIEYSTQLAGLPRHDEFNFVSDTVIVAADNHDPLITDKEYVKVCCFVLNL